MYIYCVWIPRKKYCTTFFLSLAHRVMMIVIFTWVPDYYVRTIFRSVDDLQDSKKFHFSPTGFQQIGICWHWQFCNALNLQHQLTIAQNCGVAIACQVSLLQRIEIQFVTSVLYIIGLLQSIKNRPPLHFQKREREFSNYTL